MGPDIKDILGDYRAFFADLVARLADAGIDISGCALSHLAFRTASRAEYVAVRDGLRPFCSAEVENVWNGRPIGKLLLARPLELGGQYEVSLIELIPPAHRQPFPMGLEHLGVVLGDTFDAFRAQHEAVLTGQQDQGPHCQPVYITFENERTVKFYRNSLKDVVEMEGRQFGPPPLVSMISRDRDHAQSQRSHTRSPRNAH